MVELQESTAGSWIDVQFLKAANEMVVDCRRTLKFTYVFGYYLLMDANGLKLKELFEDLQEHLERMTETLSEMTELPLDNYSDLDIPGHWLSYFGALESSDKGKYFEEMFKALSEQEKTLVVNDLKYFFGAPGGN